MVVIGVIVIGRVVIFVIVKGVVVKGVVVIGVVVIGVVVIGVVVHALKVILSGQFKRSTCISGSCSGAPRTTPHRSTVAASNIKTSDHVRG